MSFIAASTRGIMGNRTLTCLDTSVVSLVQQWACILHQPANTAAAACMATALGATAERLVPSILGTEIPHIYDNCNYGPTQCVPWAGRCARL